MLKQRQNRKKAAAFSRQLLSHIVAISLLRSANSAPPEDALAHLDWLDNFLDQYEQFAQTDAGAKLDLGVGGIGDIAYLRFALNKLRAYHGEAGVEVVGNENARIYMYFIQVKMLEMAEATGHKMSLDT